MPFPLPFSILLSMPFLISILVCVFLSPAPYCFSCSPHLAQPLFLCPLLHRDNGLLTAFQLPQGLRGLDGCRMLMSEPQHWTSAAHTAERGGGGRDMRLCQSDNDKQNEIPQRTPISVTQICFLRSLTYPTPYTCCEVMNTAWPKMLPVVELMMLRVTYVLDVLDRR